MKEIVNKIWNAPASQVQSMFNQAILIYIGITILSLIISWFIFKQIGKKMNKDFNKYRHGDWYDFDSDPFFNGGKKVKKLYV